MIPIREYIVILCKKLHTWPNESLRNKYSGPAKYSCATQALWIVITDQIQWMHWIFLRANNRFCTFVRQKSFAFTFLAHFLMPPISFSPPLFFCFLFDHRFYLLGKLIRIGQLRKSHTRAHCHEYKLESIELNCFVSNLYRAQNSNKIGVLSGEFGLGFHTARPLQQINNPSKFPYIKTITYIDPSSAIRHITCKLGWSTHETQQIQFLFQSDFFVVAFRNFE